MYYLIKDSLVECTAEECHKGDSPYVAVLTTEEWKTEQEKFDMGIDLEPDSKTILNTKAEVNYDSLTGTFSIPNRNDFDKDEWRFAFAMDEKGIVFIDSGDSAITIIKKIIRTKKWRMPSLERFIYDFLDQIVIDDLRLMEKYERELDRMEKKMMEGDDDFPSVRLNDIRSDIRDLRIHYEQLMDMGQEFAENENNFFGQENLRYFRLFLDRMARLHDTSTSSLFKSSSLCISTSSVFSSHKAIKATSG